MVDELENKCKRTFPPRQFEPYTTVREVNNIPSGILSKTEDEEVPKRKDAD